MIKDLESPILIMTDRQSTCTSRAKLSVVGEPLSTGKLTMSKSGQKLSYGKTPKKYARKIQNSGLKAAAPTIMIESLTMDEASLTRCSSAKAPSVSHYKFRKPKELMSDFGTPLQAQEAKQPKTFTQLHKQTLAARAIVDNRTSRSPRRTSGRSKNSPLKQKLMFTEREFFSPHLKESQQTIVQSKISTEGGVQKIPFTQTIYSQTAKHGIAVKSNLQKTRTFQKSMEGLTLRGKPVDACSVGLNLHGNREKVVRPERLKRDTQQAYNPQSCQKLNKEMTAQIQSRSGCLGHKLNFYASQVTLN